MVDFNIKLEKKRILITGAAGFIGSNLVEYLCKETKNNLVIGLDNMNQYYDIRLKEARLDKLFQYSSFVFNKGEL